VDTALNKHTTHEPSVAKGVAKSVAEG